MSRTCRKTEKTAKTTADYAMPLERLDPWLKEHAKLLEHRRPAVDDAGQPMIGPLRAGAQTPAFAREAWRDIVPAVVAMREYWQPIRFNKNA